MPSPTSRQSDEAVAEQAAMWIVRLSADHAEHEAIHAAFQAWKQADTRHAEAAAAMEALLGEVRSLRGPRGERAASAHVALDAALAPRRPARRRIAAALALLLALGLPVASFLHAYPPAYLMADLSTSTGEWKTSTLPDGSSISLSSASAVDIAFDATHRTVHLRMGEVLVDVAHDAHRPFVIDTEQGSMRALGTRFVVTTGAQVTALTMLRSSVEVRTSQGTRIVSAGERVSMSAAGTGPIERIDPEGVDDAWTHHQLVVTDVALADVLDTLNRYRPGIIRYNRDELAALRVSAVLPLDDSGRSLELLAASFPTLRVRKVTRYLAFVDAPSR